MSGNINKGFGLNAGGTKQSHLVNFISFDASLPDRTFGIFNQDGALVENPAVTNISFANGKLITMFDPAGLTNPILREIHINVSLVQTSSPGGLFDLLFLEMGGDGATDIDFSSTRIGNVAYPASTTETKLTSFTGLATTMTPGRFYALGVQNDTGQILTDLYMWVSLRYESD